MNKDLQSTEKHEHDWDYCTCYEPCRHPRHCVIEGCGTLEKDLQSTEKEDMCKSCDFDQIKGFIIPYESHREDFVCQACNIDAGGSCKNPHCSYF